MKKFTVVILALSLVLSGLVLIPARSEATGADAVIYDAGYSIADYWSVSTKKVPVKDGYVFGGWYSGDGSTYTALREEDLTDAGVASMSAYAKFVPADVLSVKTQVSTDTPVALRLLSTVDSTEYKSVGFQYQLGSRARAEKTLSKVYSSIKPSKTSTDILQPAESFVAASNYFIALDITNISTNSYESIVYARAFWVTMDGTKVLGLARNNRVYDNQNSLISAGVNLLSEDAGIAAGKVVVSYNTADYDVAVASEVYKIDTGSALPEMDFYVNESAGTITFVGNAATVNTDSAADGLLANIRFTKSGTGDLALTVTSSEFYDWNEVAVTGISVR